LHPDLKVICKKAIKLLQHVENYCKFVIFSAAGTVFLNEVTNSYRQKHRTDLYKNVKKNNCTGR